ncbi:MAG TPA: hypothetical protein VFQ39_17505, partial [Longimicrobium sp.]|nr:hypothetical protein [Longimicrobium sp.]
WNLSPLEERWEAIEECERRFRDTRLRVSTEQIGLARLPDGTDLVRIGRPLRPEFAAWRYGGMMGSRYRRSWLSAGTAAGVATTLGGAVALAGGTLALSPLILVGLPVIAIAEAMKAKLPAGVSAAEARKGLRALRDDTGQVMLAPNRELLLARIYPGTGHDWSLRMKTGLPDHLHQNTGVWIDEREHEVTGARAVRALSLMLARANAFGASRREVDDAVRELTRAVLPARYFAQSERDARKAGWGYGDVRNLPYRIRLTLEMASHEDTERRALEGELAELETWWREAEEIARVADTLAIPPAVERRLPRRGA